MLTEFDSGFFSTSSTTFCCNFNDITLINKKHKLDANHFKKLLNKGDVTIICKNNEQIKAVSYILETNYFKIKNGKII